MLTPILKTVAARIPTAAGEFRLHFYTNDLDRKEHLALVMGDVAGHGEDDQGVLVRVHSECFTGDVLGSQRCDCGEQLHRAMQMIAAEGRGVIVYLRQEGRGIGLEKKLHAYNLQDQGYDTVDANLLLGHQADERSYWAAAAILAELGVRSIRLLTNNPDKIERLAAEGVQVRARVGLAPSVTAENAAYLATKAERMRHMLNLNGPAAHRGAPAATRVRRGAPPAAGAHDDAPLPAGQARRLAALRERIAAHTAAHPERPFVTVTYAQSVDGSIAAADGGRLLLSSPASLRLTHALRAAHNAILVGAGTVLADDPSLTLRLAQGEHPQPVVLDSRLRIPETARLLRGPRPVWIATTAAADPARRARLEALGARVCVLPADADGRVDLHALLSGLGQAGMYSLMVEGGAAVLAAFLGGGLADAAVVTVAPRFVGGLPALARSSAQATLEEWDAAPCGPDLILWGRPAVAEERPAQRAAVL